MKRPVYLPSMFHLRLYWLIFGWALLTLAAVLGYTVYLGFAAPTNETVFATDLASRLKLAFLKAIGPALGVLLMLLMGKLVAAPAPARMVRRISRRLGALTGLPEGAEQPVGTGGPEWLQILGGAPLVAVAALLLLFGFPSAGAIYLLGALFVFNARSALARSLGVVVAGLLWTGIAVGFGGIFSGVCFACR